HLLFLSLHDALPISQQHLCFLSFHCIACFFLSLCQISMFSYNRTDPNNSPIKYSGNWPNNPCLFPFHSYKTPPEINCSCRTPIYFTYYIISFIFNFLTPCIVSFF